MDCEALAAFQAALLDLLAEDPGAEALVARLQADPAGRPFAAHVAAWEPRSLAVAAELFRLWYRRPGEPGATRPADGSAL